MNRTPRLSIVIVNYAGWPDVERLTAKLASAPEVGEGFCELIVVDNASPGPIPKTMLNPPGGVRLVARLSNDGFAAGVNAGRRVSQAPWLLMLNPDVDVEDDFLPRLFSRLDHYETRPTGIPGIVGFALLNSDGTRQGSVGVPPSLPRCVVEPLIPRARRKYQPASRVQPGPVAWVTGACALARTEMLTQVGGMDDEFFLYYEEVALCEAARRAGWSVEYDPKLEVVHRNPLQSRALSPMMRVVTRHSKLLYFRKYLPRWHSNGLCRLIAIESAVRRRLSAVLRKREEARAWRIIADLARQFRQTEPDYPRGREVLSLVDSVVRLDRRGPTDTILRGRTIPPSPRSGLSPSRKGHGK